MKSCFSNVPHNVILNFVPLTPSYRFLLDNWLIGPIFDSQEKKTYFLKKGVPEGSVFGPLCVNFVFDGLEDSLEEEYDSQRNSFYFKSGKRMFS